VILRLLSGTVVRVPLSSTTSPIQASACGAKRRGRAVNETPRLFDDLLEGGVCTDSRAGSQAGRNKAFHRCFALVAGCANDFVISSLNRDQPTEELDPEIQQISLGSLRRQRTLKRRDGGVDQLYGFRKPETGYIKNQVAPMRLQYQKRIEGVDNTGAYLTADQISPTAIAGRIARELALMQVPICQRNVTTAVASGVPADMPVPSALGERELFDCDLPAADTPTCHCRTTCSAASLRCCLPRNCPPSVTAPL